MAATVSSRFAVETILAPSAASTRGGFFERWTQHAKVGGDALGFKALGPSEYQVSILQVSAGFETDEDILRTEYAWMEKLQSRSMGINGNPPAAAMLPQEPPSVSHCRSAPGTCPRRLLELRGSALLGRPGNFPTLPPKVR
jgi:hypothetical protein